MQTIISENNPLIKEIRSLKTKKYREEKRLYFIEGFKLIQEALESNEKVISIIVSDTMKNENKVTELIKIAQNKNYTINKFAIPDKVLRRLSDTETPQGVMAIVKMRDNDLDDLKDVKKFNNLKSPNNLFIILDQIQDPGNMGTIIRTADAADFDGVIVLKGCVDVYNPKVLRSTMGSIFHLPVIYCNEITSVIQYLKQKDIKIYATHLDGAENLYDLKIHKNAAFIIGNEANGISSETSLLADTLVKIPMLGQAESLNASIAAGIIIYETVRQRL